MLTSPLAREVQDDGRIRLWGTIPEYGDRALRIVVLSDGDTIHNAFFDRNFIAGEKGKGKQS